MIKFIDVTGKTEDEAIQSALAQLKMDRDDVSVEILERAKAGFLGIGSAPARVRVSYDDGKAEEVKPVEKPAAPKPEKKVEPASAPKAVPMYAPEVLQKKESRANDKPRTERGDRPAREDRREDRRENRAPRAERAERPVPQPKPIVGLGEECHDEKSEQIRAFLKGLLEHMDSAAEVKVYESEKGRYKVFLEGEKLGALIGRRGETLDAIQQLTNYSINRGSEKNRARVQVDAENYREKREATLRALARRMAQKAIKYKRNMVLEPMNPYERRIIHSELQTFENVDTHSVGSDENRKVVITYEGADKAEQKRSQKNRRNSSSKQGGAQKESAKSAPVRRISEEESAKIQETYAAYQEEKAGRERPRRASSIDEILGSYDEPDEPVGL